MWSACALALFLWGWHYAYHSKVFGFSVAKITSDFSCRAEWEAPPLSEEEQKRLNQILSQPFHYLGAGSQSYAFVSQDGKAVLKFFRMKHQIYHLKDLWRGDRSQERKENLFSIYDSHKLAFEEMKEDAGLIYIHLNKTNHLHKKVQVVDRLHRTYWVDLDKVEFVLQEKAELIFDRLKSLMQQNNKAAVNDALVQFMYLIRRRIDKGIADHDKAVKHNFGFIGDRPIQIDVGRIYRGYKPKDSERMLERIDRWLDQQS